MGMRGHCSTPLLFKPQTPYLPHLSSPGILQPGHLLPPPACLQHYAAKALENVFGLGGPWAQQLASADTAARLVQVGWWPGAAGGLAC
jgi:hypothetical protein